MSKPTILARPRRLAAYRAQAREVFRDEILAAAEQVFARRGITGTRMSDVATAAGLATGTLYNYFANRDTLLSSLFERRSEELMDAVREAAAASASAGPREVLESLVRTSFEQMERRRALFAALWGPAGISGKHMASISRQCVDSQRSYHELLGSVLERARGAGLVRSDVPLSVLVGFLAGAVHGVMRGWMAEQEPSPLVDRARAVVDLFLRGASSPSCE